VVQEISATGGKAIGFATDVTKRAEVEALIQGAVDSFGRVDVLLNNAGIMPIAPIGALKVGEWNRQIDVNIQELTSKYLRTSQSGRVQVTKRAVRKTAHLPSCVPESSTPRYTTAVY
jgi:NAD(P)-dependent dehydrogenase (short-subunit alcohol dehydrogenase family)